jgi:hypothetical protein
MISRFFIATTGSVAPLLAPAFPALSIPTVKALVDIRP